MFFSLTSDDCVFSAFSGIGSFGRRPRVYHVEGNVAVGKSECAQLVAESIREKGARVAVVDDEKVVESSTTDDDDVTDRTLDASLRGFDECLRRHACASKALAEGFDVVLVVRHPTTILKMFEPPKRVASLFERAGDSIPDFLSTPKRTIYVKNSARSCRERATRRGRDGEKHLDEAAFEAWHERLEDVMREREVSGGEVYTFDTFGADSSQVVPAVVGCLGF